MPWNFGPAESAQNCSNIRSLYLKHISIKISVSCVQFLSCWFVSFCSFAAGIVFLRLRYFGPAESSQSFSKVRYICSQYISIKTSVSCVQFLSWKFPNFALLLLVVLSAISCSCSRRQMLETALAIPTLNLIIFQTGESARVKFTEIVSCLLIVSFNTHTRIGTLALDITH